jgi:hypothetical protein
MYDETQQIHMNRQEFEVTLQRTAQKAPLFLRRG